jgi:hypothetical protein
VNKRWVAVTLLALLGCRPQAAECKKYIDCVEALNPGSGESLKDRYGPDGTCWSTSDAQAATCSSACKTALSVAQAGTTVPDACK